MTRARCLHGAPWWRSDCPGCRFETDATSGPTKMLTWRALLDWPEKPWPKRDPWWGWDDGYGNVTCGPCGAQLQHGATHRCPGARQTAGNGPPLREEGPTHG